MALEIYEEIDLDSDDFYEGMEKTKNNFADIDTEVAAARGAMGSVAARLAPAINEDGTLVSGATGVDWSSLSFATCTKSTTYVFTVTMATPTDLTGILCPGRGVRINGTLYGTIKTSTYASPTTTVTLFDDVVPATLTALAYGIVHMGDTGCILPVEPIATRPTWDLRYSGRFLYALDSGVLWFGNSYVGAFTPMGGTMTYKDYTRSADKGGAGITVTQAGGAVTTRLDFNTPQTLAGTLISLVVCGTSRAAVTCDDLDVKIYVDDSKADDELIASWEGINCTVSPYGLILTNLNLAAICEDATYPDSLWIELTNNKAADTSIFDIEAIFEQKPLG